MRVAKTILVVLLAASIVLTVFCAPVALAETKAWVFPGETPGTYKRVFALNAHPAGSKIGLIWGIEEAGALHTPQLFESDMTGRATLMAGSGESCTFEQLRDSPEACGHGAGPKAAKLSHVNWVTVLQTGEILVGTQHSGEGGGKATPALWEISQDRSVIRLILKEGDLVDKNFRLDRAWVAAAATHDDGFLLYGVNWETRSFLKVWKATRNADGKWVFAHIAGRDESPFDAVQGNNQATDPLRRPEAAFYTMPTAQVDQVMVDFPEIHSLPDNEFLVAKRSTGQIFKVSSDGQAQFFAEVPFRRGAGVPKRFNSLGVDRDGTITVYYMQGDSFFSTTYAGGEERLLGRRQSDRPYWPQAPGMSSQDYVRACRQVDDMNEADRRRRAEEGEERRLGGDGRQVPDISVRSYVAASDGTIFVGSEDGLIRVIGEAEVKAPFRPLAMLSQEDLVERVQARSDAARKSVGEHLCKPIPAKSWTTLVDRLDRTFKDKTRSFIADDLEALQEDLSVARSIQNGPNQELEDLKNNWSLLPRDVKNLVFKYLMDELLPENQLKELRYRLTRGGV